MRNKLSVLVSAAVLALFSACTEKGPYIDFGDTKSVDTTYITTPPAPQARKVLVEEFTGAKCSNCPDARAVLATLSEQRNDRLIILGIHIHNFPQSEPVKGSKYDFRTQDGTDIGNMIFGSVIGMPMAGIDRVPNDKGEILLLKNDWASAIDRRLDKPVDVNLDLASSFDPATRTAEVKMTITYLKPMSGQQHISLAILEDGLIDKQDSVGAVIEEYEFKHVLRDYITPPTGIALSQDITDKEAGRVFERIFTYEVDESWAPENCHFVAFIHQNQGNSKEVLQAAEVHVVE